MSSDLTGRSDKMSAGFIIIGILTMALGHGSVNIIGAIDKYNQWLKPKWNIM